MKEFPDFTKIAFDSTPAKTSYDDWRAQFKAETGKSVEDWAFMTLEQVELKSLYTAADLACLVPFLID